MYSVGIDLRLRAKIDPELRAGMSIVLVSLPSNQMRRQHCQEYSALYEQSLWQRVSLDAYSGRLVLDGVTSLKIDKHYMLMMQLSSLKY